MIPQAYVALNNTKVGTQWDHQGKIATVSFMDNRGLDGILEEGASEAPSRMTDWDQMLKLKKDRTKVEDGRANDL